MVAIITIYLIIHVFQSWRKMHSAGKARDFMAILWAFFGSFLGLLLMLFVGIPSMGSIIVCLLHIEEDEGYFISHLLDFVTNVTIFQTIVWTPYRRKMIELKKESK